MSPTQTWALVFVKAPTPGLVKTRLLSVLSPEESATLYRTLVRDTLEALAAVPDIHRVVAYAPDPAFPDLTWLGEYPMVRQEGGTLGARLQHAFAWAFAQDAPRVIAIGSDAPALPPEWLRGACEALERVEVVIGPTRDGGYQLIGLRRLYPELFADMPWSTPHLCARTLERAAQLGLRAHCLEPVEDLDTPEDLRCHLAALALTKTDLSGRVLPPRDSPIRPRPPKIVGGLRPMGEASPRRHPPHDGRGSTEHIAP